MVCDIFIYRMGLSRKLTKKGMRMSTYLNQLKFIYYAKHPHSIHVFASCD